MLLTAIASSPLLAKAATAAKADPAIGTVVFTGLSLVFAILILLYLVVVLEGAIFRAMDKRKQAKAEKASAALAAPAAVPTPAAAPAAVQPAAPAGPAIETRIPPDVVAAITAAVHAASEGKYTLRSVSTVQKGRGQWGLAGVIQNTEPF